MIPFRHLFAPFVLLIWFALHGAAFAQITVPISDIDPKSPISGTVTAVLLEGSEDRIHLRLTGRSEQLLPELDRLLDKEINSPFYWKRQTQITGGNAQGVIHLKSRAGVKLLLGQDTKSVHWSAHVHWDNTNQRAVLSYKVGNIKGLGGVFEDLLRSWFTFMDGKVFWGVADSEVLASLSPQVLDLRTKALGKKGLQIDIDLSVDRAATGALILGNLSDLGPSLLNLLMRPK